MIIPSCMFPSQMRPGEREVTVCGPEYLHDVAGALPDGMVVHRAIPLWPKGTRLPAEPGWMLYIVGVVIEGEGRNTDERCRDIAAYVQATWVKRTLLRAAANVRLGGKARFKTTTAENYAHAGRQELSRVCAGADAYWAPLATEMQVINGHVVQTFSKVIIGALVASTDEAGAFGAYDYAIAQLLF